MTAMTLCSKSPWNPAMRREHAFTRSALRHGVAVTFIEPPSDVRSFGRCGPRKFLRGLRGGVRAGGDAGLHIIARTTAIPGHWARPAELIDVTLLRRILADQTDDEGPTICNLPWQWRATRNRRLRVFDCADDWTRLLPPDRGLRLSRLFQQIGDEADAVIVASPDLVHLFGDREVCVVPNGADPGSIRLEASKRPGSHSLVYVGTFSERFDTDAVTHVMRARTDCRLDLYGPCQYAGSGDRPVGDLLELLGAFPERLRWHGSISREDVAGAIDRADVVIVPHRPDQSQGQSSMKLFDSAARGRPAVISAGVSCVPGGSPPGTYVVEHADQWADAVTAAENEPVEEAASRIAWARANTWESRWPQWARSALGCEPNAALV
jgi:glycosyltransferase involved in cell wall biosynthesis